MFHRSRHRHHSYHRHRGRHCHSHGLHHHHHRRCCCHRRHHHHRRSYRHRRYNRAKEKICDAWNNVMIKSKKIKVKCYETFTIVSCVTGPVECHRRRM